MAPCGHINKHHHGINGKLEDLACTLEQGHDGDHSAEHLALRMADDNFETAKQIQEGAQSHKFAGKMWLEVKEMGFWSDGASIPAADIKPDLAQLAELKRKAAE